MGWVGECGEYVSVDGHTGIRFCRWTHRGRNCDFPHRRYEKKNLVFAVNFVFTHCALLWNGGRKRERGTTGREEKDSTGRRENWNNLPNRDYEYLMMTEHFEISRRWTPMNTLYRPPCYPYVQCAPPRRRVSFFDRVATVRCIGETRKFIFPSLSSSLSAGPPEKCPKRGKLEGEGERIRRRGGTGLSSDQQYEKHGRWERRGEKRSRGDYDSP